MDSPFDCVCPLGARLGECPVWEADRQTLRFTDINGRRLHRFDLGSGRLDTLDLTEELGCFAPVADGSVVAATRSGIWRMQESG